MTRTAPYEPDPRSEMSSLIRATLGHPVDSKKLAALINMRERLQAKIDTLSDELMERQIGPSDYLERLELALLEASQAGEDILGADFHKVFGELRVDRLGDAKIFLEQYSRGH